MARGNLVPEIDLADFDEQTLDLYEAALDEQQHDPAFFIEHALGHNLWEKQREIVCSVRDHQRTAVRSCHGAGKTYTAAQILLWFAYSFPHSIVLTTAPTFRQVERILWKELRVAWKSARVPLGGFMRKVPALEISDDWFSIGFSTDEPDAFQGHHEESVLVVFDEASGIGRDLWISADSVLTSANCRLLAIGNPTDPTSQFFDEFKVANVSKISISAFQTPNFTAFGLTEETMVDGSWRNRITGPLPNPKLITPEWVADKVLRWGVESSLWKSRVIGEFPDTGTDALIPLSWVEAAAQRDIEPTEPIELACDVARFGDDETVIGGRAGRFYRMVYNEHDQDLMRTCGEVVRALSDTGASVARIDEIGVGAGVLDRLVELERPVEGINAGKPANDPERFVNARAEMFWGLRERFDPREAAIDIDPDDDELHSQLASIKYKVDSRGRIQIESKEDMKKRGLASPDRADTLAMAFYKPASSDDVQLW